MQMALLLLHPILNLHCLMLLLYPHLHYLHILLLAHTVVSFSHVRRDANKAADLLANIGVEGETSFHYGTLEVFGVEVWAQQCRKVVFRDLNIRP